MQLLHPIAEASGYLGSILGIAMVVPQIVRTYRNRTVPGVSAMSWALTAVACLTWMFYGVRTAEIPQIPGNVLLVAGSVVVVLAVPSSTSVALRALGLGASAAALLAGAIFLPPTVIGIVGFLLAAVSGVPQIVVSLTRRVQTSAVSALTWVLRIASQACWLFYALVLRDVVVAVSASFILASAALVLVAVRARRPAAVPVPDPVLARNP
jgi:uncharacterized protein with PQ loop repeat